MSSSANPDRDDITTRAAVETIEEGIRRAERRQRTIDTAIARMIAIQLGSLGSFLQHFGLTGTLYRSEALFEMELLDVDEDHQLWAGALWDYLDRPRHPRHGTARRAA